MKRLEKENLNIIYMVDVQGMTFRAVAELLKRSVSTVHGRYEVQKKAILKAKMKRGKLSTVK